MIRSKIAQLLGRSAGGGAKLVVIAYDHAGHYFHELLGYTTAANALGISLRIIAAKLVDPAIAAQLHAERAIDSLPHTWGIHPPKTRFSHIGTNIPCCASARIVSFEYCSNRLRTSQQIFRQADWSTVRDHPPSQHG